MRIYTRGGDRGETDLLDGPRVAKDEARLEVCGTVDELNSLLGLVRAEPLPEGIDALLKRLQSELLAAGAELADIDPVARGMRKIGPKHVETIEKAIDRHQAGLEPLGGFILPAGTRAAALMHLARTVCRRAERRLITLVRGSEQEISPDLMAYVNRLSDLLFVLARAVNASAGRGDTPWQKDV